MQELIRVLIEKNDFEAIDSTLRYLTKTDKSGKLNGNMIDPHIEDFLKIGVNLKHYFKSNIVFYEIKGVEEFVSHHTDPQKLIKAAPFESLVEVQKHYSIIKDDLNDN